MEWVCLHKLCASSSLATVLTILQTDKEILESAFEKIMSSPGPTIKIILTEWENNLLLALRRKLFLHEKSEQSFVISHDHKLPSPQESSELLNTLRDSQLFSVGRTQSFCSMSTSPRVNKHWNHVDLKWSLFGQMNELLTIEQRIGGLKAFSCSADHSVVVLFLLNRLCCCENRSSTRRKYWQEIKHSDESSQSISCGFGQAQMRSKCSYWGGTPVVETSFAANWQFSLGTNDYHHMLERIVSFVLKMISEICFFQVRQQQLRLDDTND
jgi:hypothetical protein